MSRMLRGLRRFNSKRRSRPIITEFGVSNVAPTQVSLIMRTADIDGTIYIVIILDGVTVPNAVQISQGKDGTGAAAFWSVTKEIVATEIDEELGIEFSDIPVAVNTVYDVYAVQLGENGVFSSVATETFTTQIPIVANASPFFQDEITAVDATKTLIYEIDGTYDQFEWSYNGLTIKGGSDLACEYGAVALLEAMGFRFYVPDTGAGGNNGQFRKRPVSIPTNLTQVQTTDWLVNTNIFLVYGHSWDDVNAASRDLLGGAYSKWARLNGVSIQPWPAGHRWGNIVSTNLAFFQANPQLIQNSGTTPVTSSNASSRHFDLTVTGADYTNLVEICAAEILKQGLNLWNRTNFDPTDGDLNPSDLVFPFSKAVAAKVRSGTAAIGTHPIRAGVPTAQLGVYAYSGHRLPPTDSASPGVFTMVALAFNNTALTYQQLIDGHGAKSDAILIREYLDTQVFSQGTFANKKLKDDYLESYDAHVAAGAKGMTSEFGANWLNNIVMMRCALRKFKTGTYTMQQARDDVIADIFGDDAAVHGLYELLGEQLDGYHKWALREAFDYVDAMQAGWYKGYFQQWACILYEYLYLPIQTPLAQQTPSDPFPAAFTTMMGFITAARDLDITHSYAWLRQLANSNVRTNYPLLAYNATPRPAWFASPVAATPADFATRLTAIRADAIHDADMDSMTLSLITNMVPVVSNATNGTRFATKYQVRFLFYGPGDISTQQGNDTPIVTNYGVGIHEIRMDGERHTWNTGGYLFLDTFPAAYINPVFFPPTYSVADGHKWLYIPNRAAGNVRLESDVRLTIIDADGRIDIFPRTNALYVSPANLGPGQVQIHNINTRGTMYNPNCNRYISLHQNVALIPTLIATEDGLI